jgi:hypothetical protein
MCVAQVGGLAYRFSLGDDFGGRVAHPTTAKPTQQRQKRTGARFYHGNTLHDGEPVDMDYASEI